MKWASADEDVPEGTVGSVLRTLENGTVEVAWPSKAAGDNQIAVFAFHPSRLEKVGQLSPGHTTLKALKYLHIGGVVSVLGNFELEK